MANEAVLVKPAVVVETRSDKYGYISGSLGMLAGFGVAYKRDYGVLGYLGWGLFGSFVGGTIGTVLAKVVGEKMVAVVTPAKPKDAPKGGGQKGGLPTDKVVNASGNDNWGA